MNPFADENINPTFKLKKLKNNNEIEYDTSLFTTWPRIKAVADVFRLSL